MATKKEQTAQAVANWNANQPEKYNDQYTEQVNNVLQTLAGRNFSQDYSAASDPNYQNYAKNYTAAAQAAAQNAKATTAALSGGYGSSYADSVASQAYQDNMSAMNNILPTLRSQALNDYQADTNSLETLLSGLQTAGEQAYSAYNTNVNNWQNWRDALTTDAEQEQTNSDNFWNNVKSALQWVAKAGLGAYDAYKGYTQQEWENQFNEQQQQANYMALGYQAAEAGQTDLANQYGTLAGLGEGYFTNYTPTTSSTMSYSDVADAYSTMASLAANGQYGLAQQLGQMYGLDTSGLANTYASKTSSSGSSGSSTSSNLMKIYSEMASLAGDGQYGLAQQLGQTYGLDTSSLADTYASKNGSTSSGLSLSDLTSLASAYDSTANSNPAKSTMAQILTDYGTQYSAAQQQADTDAQIASLTQKYAAMGYTDEQIYYRLKHLGLTN
jgi:hypothetical protein